MAGMLNIGLTGLNAAQLQLNTASHNIANAATPGFNRQSAVQTSNDPLFSGAGYFGQGARVVSVNRQYNQFLEAQVLSADNRRAEHATYGAQVSQINNLFADPQAGLAPALENFFAAMQEVANNPSVIPARQSLISASQEMVARFSVMDERMNEIREGAEGEIRSTVESVNSLASQIADLNERISIALAAGGYNQPNDLLDQRDNTLAELNRLIKARGVVDNQGQMAVFVGAGQNLVLGQTVTRLGTEVNPADPTRQSVTIIAPGGASIPLPEHLLGGGALGGLLAFRSDTLDPAQSRLNLVARQVTESVNSQHRLGIDLENLLGGDFFRNTMVRAEGSAVNPPEVRISDDRLLTNDRYRLVYDNSVIPQGFTFTRMSDNQVVNPLDVGVSIQASAAALNGDSFIIEPLRNSARDMSVNVNDPRRIAAGAPVSVQAQLLNGGSGRVEKLTMESTAGIASPVNFANFAIVYDAGALSFDPPPPAGLTLSSTTYNTGTDAIGKRFDVTLPGGGGQVAFSFTLSGAPENGDRFSFSPNTEAPADNRNVVALGALQTARTMLARNDASNDIVPSATFQSAYSQIASQVGNKAREAQVGERAQATMLRQAQDARDALSGVNLDEEAANLIRYQQAYQASGRVMSIAQRMFDELLSLAR